jgi:hypothetical protein
VCETPAGTSVNVVRSGQVCYCASKKQILWFFDGFEITQNHSQFFFSKPRLSEQSNTGSNSGLEFLNNKRGGAKSTTKIE